MLNSAATGLSSSSNWLFLRLVIAMLSECYLEGATREITERPLLTFMPRSIPMNSFLSARSENVRFKPLSYSPETFRLGVGGFAEF